MTNDGVKSEIAEKNSNFGGAKSSIGFVQNITCASVWSPLPLREVDQRPASPVFLRVWKKSASYF
jgi:hypothetical protein